MIIWMVGPKLLRTCLGALTVNTPFEDFFTHSLRKLLVDIGHASLRVPFVAGILSDTLERKYLPWSFPPAKWSVKRGIAPRPVHRSFLIFAIMSLIKLPYASSIPIESYRNLDNVLAKNFLSRTQA